MIDTIIKFFINDRTEAQEGKCLAQGNISIRARVRFKGRLAAVSVFLIESPLLLKQVLNYRYGNRESNIT